MSQETPRQPEPPRPAPPPEQAPPPPWRTEGLPKGTPPKRPTSWAAWLPWLLGYALVFAIVTLQDRFAGPQPVPYTEFKAQVAAHNVEEVFARGNTIQGALKQPKPGPGQQGQTYQQFTTERPTFAADDLLSELEASAATVRATPLVQERGFLTNLVVSMAPLLLLFGFYALLFRRQQRALGGGLGALFGSTARRPVDPQSVRGGRRAGGHQPPGRAGPGASTPATSPSPATSTWTGSPRSRRG